MEEFIEVIKKHPCLWNPSHKDYRDGYKRDRVWHRIVNLNLDIKGVHDIKSAKSEWKKLRDTHRDSLKRHKDKTAPNPWKFAREMEFLVPHIKTRLKRCGAPDYYAEQTECDGNNSPASMYVQSSYLSEDEEDEEDDSKVLVQNEIAGFAQKRRADTNTSDLMIEIEKAIKRQEKHPIDYFFDSMAETTKSLPLHFQNRIKKGVLDIVCQAEEEMESLNRSGQDN